jgi:pseudaminic acid cytidylyltransferase
MNVAIIPARGGSKRIPRKNAKIFAGKPMIAWAIGTALESGLFDRVIVSTDDGELAELAGAAGAETPFTRPAHLADDFATTIDVVAHAAEWCVANGLAADAFCCIYATTPLLLASDLSAAAALLTPECDFVFAAARYANPVQRGFLREPDGGVAMLFPDLASTRSQDLPAVYFDAGQFYWGQRAAWLDRRAIFGPSSRFVEMPAERAVDIDTPDDWREAELNFARMALATRE